MSNVTENQEAMTLGRILLHNALLHRSPSADFAEPRHQAIFAAMLALDASETPIDTVTPRETLALQGKLAEVGGDEYLLALTDLVLP